MLMLRWLGIEPGEIDYPRLYLQCNVSMNMEAKVVMIDVKEDFTINQSGEI